MSRCIAAASDDPAEPTVLGQRLSRAQRLSLSASRWLGRSFQRRRPRPGGDSRHNPHISRRHLQSYRVCADPETRAAYAGLRVATDQVRADHSDSRTISTTKELRRADRCVRTAVSAKRPRIKLIITGAGPERSALEADQQTYGESRRNDNYPVL